LGSITKHLFHGHPIYTLVLGGGFMILAGILTLLVEDKDDPIHIRKK
jgi:maltose/moltooligosaccharide transporter